MGDLNIGMYVDNLRTAPGYKIECIIYKQWEENLIYLIKRYWQGKKQVKFVYIKNTKQLGRSKF